MSQRERSDHLLDHFETSSLGQKCEKDGRRLMNQLQPAEPRPRSNSLGDIHGQLGAIGSLTYRQTGPTGMGTQSDVYKCGDCQQVPKGDHQKETFKRR